MLSMIARSFLLLTAVFLISCGTANDHPAVQAEDQNPQNSPDNNEETQAQIVKTISVAEFQSLLKSTANARLIDVRTPEEVAGGVIDCADNFDFYDTDFSKRIGELDRNAPVFVYCAVGGRSGQATQVFKDAGFKTVYNLDGGIRGWTGSGLPVAPCAK
jgi:rhodanese-related sulfurtransferase